MLTTLLVAATIASAPTASVTHCHIDSHGNANQCVQIDVAPCCGIGIGGWMSPRTTLTWNKGRVYLYRPRVNGHRGHWNFDHTLLRWPRLKVTFDGISFMNYGSHHVHVMSHTT